MRIGNEPQGDATPATVGRRRAGWLALGLLAFAGGCRTDMYDQPHKEVYEPTSFFKDGTSNRPVVAGTVARGELRADPAYYEGKVDGKDIDYFPFPVDEATLETGRTRFMVYCMPCHGQLGDGRGMVVRRGFSPPPTFHSEYLRKIPVGHFFNVITHGYGAMYSYASRIPVRHRWAIAAYIRTLQYSQDADRNDLNEADLKVIAGLEAPGQPNRVDRKSLAEAHQ